MAVPSRYVVGPPLANICIVVSMVGHMIFSKIHALLPNRVLVMYGMAWSARTTLFPSINICRSIPFRMFPRNVCSKTFIISFRLPSLFLPVSRLEKPW